MMRNIPKARFREHDATAVRLCAGAYKAIRARSGAGAPVLRSNPVPPDSRNVIRPAPYIFQRLFHCLMPQWNRLNNKQLYSEANRTAAVHKE